MTLTARAEKAPAKINLTLRVLGRRADGYHELESLVAFAGVGDALTFAPGGALTLAVSGPTAKAAGDSADNLVLKAARTLAEGIGGLTLGRFALSKRLPVAAGLGGGSADAAAALRLLARANGIASDDPRLMQAARAKVFAATKASKIFFLNSMNADNIVDMIKEGVMVGPASQQAAEIGRKFTKRTMPW